MCEGALKAILLGLLIGLMGICLGFYVVTLSGAEPVEDLEVFGIYGDVLTICDKLNMECSKPVLFLWRDATFDEYAGMAPLMHFPVPQIILLDREHWNRIPYRCKRDLVAHELGHALLGWAHHADSNSIMTQEWHCREDLVKAFRRAKEIENEIH